MKEYIKEFLGNLALDTDIETSDFTKIKSLIEEVTKK